jgi:hypothetical protein
MTLQEAILSIIKDKVYPNIVVGTVKSFSASNCTIDVELNQGGLIDEVRIRAVIDGVQSGIMVEPKIGSYVLLGLINGNKESLFVLGFSEIVKYHLKADKIEFNGEAFGGLVKIDTLIERINRLENNFLTHIHTTPAGPSGTPQDATLAPIVFTPTLKIELENPNVKHG